MKKKGWIISSDGDRNCQCKERPNWIIINFKRVKLASLGRPNFLEMFNLFWRIKSLLWPGRIVLKSLSKGGRISSLFGQKFLIYITRRLNCYVQDEIFPGFVIIWMAGLCYLLKLNCGVQVQFAEGAVSSPLPERDSMWTELGIFESWIIGLHPELLEDKFAEGHFHWLDRDHFVLQAELFYLLPVLWQGSSFWLVHCNSSNQVN